MLNDIVSEYSLAGAYLISRCAAIANAKDSFWDFCRVESSDFYKPGHTHLTKMCDVLNDFYYGKLLRADGEPYKKLIMNIPPQFGKTRTLVNFCKWALGRNNEERIIACSYNDNTASDFSRYTRDGIQKRKIEPTDIVYSDIFPETKIQQGHSSYQKWALEGQHFNYLGAGIGGSITSKGATILIVDDPIKGAIEALNENLLSKIWIWYTSTLLSRAAAEGGEPLEIVVMTRWSKHDICGRLLKENPDDWYVLRMEAYDKEKDEMLCPAFLDRKRYFYLKAHMMDEIFFANYHQEPLDVKGRLYKTFKTYEKLPQDINGRVLFEKIANYTDTADEGSNYLCSINYGIYQGEAYVLGVYYTKEGMEVTESGTAQFLADGNVDEAHVESNSGGRGFARSVERILWEKHHIRRPSIRWFHQSKNKESRILSNSTFVQDHILFPVDWKNRWPQYYEAMNTFLKEGKNKFDDAPDATTGVAERMARKFTGTGLGVMLGEPR